jgi:hypothetical protein
MKVLAPLMLAGAASARMLPQTPLLWIYYG